MGLNIPETDKKRVVVVGGGFAGLSFVKKLEKSNYQVVLIDRNNTHQFQPLLYQVATAALSPGDIAFPFRKLLHGKKNVYFRMALVEKVDAENKTVFTSRGHIAYDYLVLAIGTSTNFFGIKNIEEQSMRMKDLSESLEIRNKVLFNIEKGVQAAMGSQRRQELLNIVIVGGGAAGVELAGAFAEMKRYIIPKDYPELTCEDVSVYLLEGSPHLLNTLSDKTSEDTLDILVKRGVNVHVNSIVTDYNENMVYLKNGDQIPTRNLIWTSGVKVESPEGLDKATTNRTGRIETDEYLAVKGYDSIFVIGDASLQVTEKFQNGYPQLARVAIEQAKQLGNNFIRLEKGKQLKSYSYINYPMMATVGRNSAFAEIGRFRLKGFVAWIAWVFVHIIFVLGVRNKLNVLWTWFWNYITFDLPTRIIVLPRRGKGRSGYNREY